MGVAGSSLGTQREEMTLDEGAIIDWAGHHIHYVRLEQRELPDKLVGEALLQIESDHSRPIELRPARHFHFLQNEWTSEVAIYSTWGGDLYTVLNAGLGGGKIALTLVNNPMIRWIWVGGVFTTVSAIVALLPNRRSRATAAETLSSSTLLAETLAKDHQAAIKAA
jgi:cytochrome c-type biogenesis protein CcmF